MWSGDVFSQLTINVCDTVLLLSQGCPGEEKGWCGFISAVATGEGLSCVYCVPGHADYV